MKPSPLALTMFSRALLLASFSLLIPPFAHADELRVVFEGAGVSRSTPVTNLTPQGTTFIVKTAADGFNANQILPKAAASYVQGEKPALVDEAISLILTERPLDALKLLEPFVEQQRPSAGLIGNQWEGAARAAVVAYGLTGNTDKCNALGKEISDSTPEQGNDPIISLGRILLLPFSTPLEDRLNALASLVSENSAAEVSAYASFFRALRLQKAKRSPEALEAYLLIPCAYPTGGRVLNGIAEMNAAEILAPQPARREEAVALLTSAVSYAQATSAAAEAEKRLKSLK